MENPPPSVLTLPRSRKPPPVGRAKALVFEDPRSRTLAERIERLAPTDASVLIVGETGTGKEIVARHIHDLSRRTGQPFMAVNCGAFSESLIESELFGHEKGAFTGAVEEKAGWFESAQGGTLFLDEIGDLPLGLQVKLLRVLQEREVVRLGSRKAVPVNVRVIAATNVKLEEALASGRFRTDLFYRLAVAKVSIDALRDRPGDILPLARHFMEVYSAALGMAGRAECPSLTPGAEAALLAHPWLGNIRELENAIHHALLVCEDGRGRVTPADLALSTLPAVQTADALPEAIVAPGAAAASDPRAVLRGALHTLYDEGAPQLWDQLEEMVIRSAYEHARHNQLQTARLLGLSRSVVRARLLEFGLLSRAGRDAELRDAELRDAVLDEASRGRAGGRILVIEDDGVVRQSLGQLLSESGYEVSFAENGRVALQLLAGARVPDLIVLDLKMPVMDGWEFRAIQKDDPKLSLIPVVAMSAERGAPTAALSAQAFLRKPLDAGEFLRTVERAQRKVA